MIKPTSRRRRRHARRREEILAAAARVFAKKGYRVTRISQDDAIMQDDLTGQMTHIRQPMWAYIRVRGGQ